MDPGQQDIENMHRLQAGDDLALNDLMRRWKQPLVTFCIRYTGNVTDAKDIAQETFVKVYTSRKRYRASAPFATWLFSIALNLCRMRARWQSRHPEVLDTDREFDLQSLSDSRDCADPVVQTDRNQLAIDLDEAIRGLPHELRSAILLYEINGLSYRDTAKSMACSEKAVERRLARAREKLRITLKKKWGSSFL